MEDEAADGDEDETANTHGCEPGCGQEGASAHNFLNVEGSVE